MTFSEIRRLSATERRSFLVSDVAVLFAISISFIFQLDSTLHSHIYTRQMIISLFFLFSFLPILAFCMRKLFILSQPLIQMIDNFFSLHSSDLLHFRFVVFSLSRGELLHHIVGEVSRKRWKMVRIAKFCVFLSSLCKLSTSRSSSSEKKVRLEQIELQTHEHIHFHPLQIVETSINSREWNFFYCHFPSLSLYGDTRNRLEENT